MRGIAGVRWMIGLLLVVASIGIEAADFEKGLVAYNSGDYEAAFKEWQPLAEQGNADAQFNLAIMYDNGWGVARDHRHAANWYLRAAQQGYVQAQLNLGVAYALGEGVPQDDHEAVKWYRKAAEQGNADAQHGLGLQYALGKGVAQDFLMSYVWLNLAAIQGQEQALEFQGIVEELITPSQLEEVPQLISQYLQDYVVPFQQRPAGPPLAIDPTAVH